MSEPDFQKIMQQAQKMQSNIQKAQEEIIALTVVGQAGGGLVKIKMNGRHDVLRVFVAHHLIGLKDPNKEEEEGGGDEGSGTVDKSMLEDLIAAAVNDAVRKVETASREKMTGLMSGLNLPPEMMPFGGENR